MSLLSNAIFQFIINISIAIILGGISIWIALRRPIQIPLMYETLSLGLVKPSDEEVKEILANLHITPDDKGIQLLSFVTFKLLNIGKESISLTDDKKPLIISFKRGSSILSCERVQTVPEDLEYTCRLEGEKMLLVLPLLELKESLTLGILITGYINYFPDIKVRVGLSKRIVKANNVRQSKEMLIMGIAYLCATTYMFFALRLMPPSPIQSQLWLFFGAGLFFLVLSWADRRMPPSQHLLPSTFFYVFFMSFIYALPFLIPFGILALAIYIWFGVRVLTLVYLISMAIIAPLGVWHMLYSFAAWLLKRMQKRYNAILVGALTGIPFIAFYILCAYVFIDLIIHW